jgi:hypothetical protein
MARARTSGLSTGSALSAVGGVGSGSFEAGSDTGAAGIAGTDGLGFGAGPTGSETGGGGGATGGCTGRSGSSVSGST